MQRPILVVTVGLPGVGKTTRAKELEAELGAVRLTPDEWLRPLFGPRDNTLGRDTIEGRFVSLARRLLTLGQSVILDFGVWTRAERDSLHDLAHSCGATFRMEYLHLDSEEQWRRVEDRQTRGSSTAFVITLVELDSYVAMFEPPDEAELGASEPAAPPPEAGSWANWRAARWPTSEA